MVLVPLDIVIQVEHLAFTSHVKYNAFSSGYTTAYKLLCHAIIKKYFHFREVCHLKHISQAIGIHNTSQHVYSRFPPSTEPHALSVCAPQARKWTRGDNTELNPVRRC